MLKFAFKILIIVSLCYNIQVVKGQTNDNTYIIYTLGLPDEALRNPREVIGSKWNITFRDAAICFFTNELEDSITSLNSITYKKLALRYGPDWRKKFDAEVEDEFKIENEICNLIKKQKFITEKNFNQFVPYRTHKMQPVPNSNNYIVYLEGWGEWKGYEDMEVYYTLNVNYKKQTVKILSFKYNSRLKTKL